MMCLKDREVIKHHNAEDIPPLFYFARVCTVTSKYYNRLVTRTVELESEM